MKASKGKEAIIRRKIVKVSREAKARQTKADISWRELLRQQARLAKLVWCNNEKV